MSRKSSLSSRDFQKKIKLAEEAIGKVNDPLLKPVAFQTILQHLLSQESEATEKKIRHRSEKPEQARNLPLSKGAKGRIEELIAESFFDKKKPISEIRKELGNLGYHYSLEQIAPALIRLVRDKKLRRIAEPSGKSGKVIWHYSKW